MRPVFVVLAASALVSCGPIQSGALIVDAQAELSAAETAQAARHAPFEFVAAEEYLHKAREEQSYAEFERAVDFARKSRDCAKVARSRAEAVAARDMGALEPVPETKARCRPGPDRARPMLDPDEEPAARAPEAPKPAPAKKAVSPKKTAPEEKKPRQVVKPKDEMPEGDAEDAE